MGTPLRVLIVEDSEDDALLVVETLNGGGYDMTWRRVCTPGDMASALEGEQWDAVIADHGMPRFSAPAALEVLKKKRMDLPFIIVSGTIGEDVAVAAMKAGAHDYILKNNLARLVPAVDRELQDAETRRKHGRAEESIEISHRFLQIANRHAEMSPLLEEFVGGIREYTGCGAAGIRVFDKQGAISHQAYSGFPARFYEIECPLAAESDRCRVCEVVLNGETDPKLKIFSENGSFCVNTPADFPPGAFEEQGEAADNLCGRFGYQSIAIVPFRMWDRTVGLIHVADPGANMIPERSVQMLERAAAILSTAVVRVETQQALGDSEQRYRTLVEQAKDIIFTLDPQTWKISSANNYGLETLKYSEEEVVGKMSIRDLVHPDDLEDAARSLSEMIGEDLRHPNFAFRLRKADGSYIDAEINAALIRDSEGNPQTYIGIVRDVTERKRAEEAVQRQKDLLESSIESLTHPFCVIDANNYSIRLANSAAGLGTLTADSKCHSLLHENDEPCASEEHPCPLEQVKKTKKSFSASHIHRDKDGLPRIVDVHGYPVFDKAGNVIQMIEYALDVTERHRAEEALKESEDRYRTLVENSLAGVYVRRGDSLLFVNDKVVQITGYAREELLGMSFSEVVHPDHIDRVREQVVLREAGEKAKNPLQYQIVTKSGAVRWIEALATKITYQDESAVLSNFADITERKGAEQALRESEARYRALFENTPIQIVVVDSDGVVTARNSAKRVSAEKPPMPGDRMYIDYAPLHENDMRAELMDCIMSGTPKEFPEQPYGRRILSIRMSPFPGGAIIISEDISERKRSEDWLKRSHSLLSATLESTADGIMVVDMQGNMLSSNRRFVEMWRIPEHVMASQDDEQVRSFFLEQLKNPEEALKEENEIYADPEREHVDILEFKDGRILERYTRPQKMGGKNVGMVFSFRDVTERRRAERALENSLSLLNATLESTADGILVVGMNGVYHDFNSRFLEIWNLAPEMMESLDESEILTICMNQTTDPERNIERTKEVSGDPDREWMDVIEFKDGRVVERYSRPQKLGGKTVGKVFSFHDITERRRIEKSILESREHLRSLTSQLSLAEERERRRIANQLHDRVGQSLLASKIKLGTARDSGLPTALEEPLGEVYRLIEQTIRDVRSLTFELSPPILYMLGFEAAVEWLTEQAEKQQYGIKCEFEDDGETKPLDDDIRVLLFQNVRELLVNVCKHSKAHNAKVYISREDDYIRVSVEDNGVGFDASGVETHWDESSGFGLFSIRERLSRFGGRLEIDSEPGRGTRITLTAPLKTDDEITEGETI